MRVADVVGDGEHRVDGVRADRAASPTVARQPTSGASASAATISPAIPNCRRASHSHMATRSISLAPIDAGHHRARQSAFVTSNQNVAMRSLQLGGASMFVHTKRKLGA